MDALKKFWPHAYKAEDVTGLIIAILIYAAMNFVCWLVGFLFGFIPLLGSILNAIWGVVGWLVGIYATVGVVIALLHFFKILK